MRTSSSQIALFITVALLAAGCQQEPGALTPVTGRVTFKGVPLRGGLIVFVPDAGKGENGPIAHSKIAEDGTYNLFTGDAAGAHAGWYQVTVSSPGPATNQTGQPSNSSESIVPGKYSHPELSKIACKIDAHQANSFDFDLK
jgi:hypothetical protein